MKLFVLLVVFVLVVVLSSISSAFFYDMFFDKASSKAKNSETLTQFNRKIENISDEIYEFGNFIDSVDYEMKNVKEQIVDLENADEGEFVNLPAKFDDENLNALQNQITEMKSKYEKMKNNLKSAKDSFGENVEAVLERKKAEEQAIREQEQKERRAQAKVQYTDYLGTVYKKHTEILAKELNLSSRQQREVSKLLERRKNDLLALRYPADNQPQGRESWREYQNKYTEVNTKYEENMKKILSNNQFENYKSKSLDNFNRAQSESNSTNNNVRPGR